MAAEGGSYGGRETERKSGVLRERETKLAVERNRKLRVLTAERVKGRALRVWERAARRGSRNQEGDREKPR